MTRLDEIKKKMLELEEETPNWKDTTVYVAGFMDGAMWADAHPHWISVEDELPPKNEAYLAYWQHLGVTKYRFIKSGAKVSRFFSEYITHWCYLPQLPVLSNSEKTGKNHLIDANNMVEHFRETTKMIEKGGEK